MNATEQDDQKLKQGAEPEPSEVEWEKEWSNFKFHWGVNSCGISLKDSPETMFVNPELMLKGFITRTLASQKSRLDAEWREKAAKFKTTIGMKDYMGCMEERCRDKSCNLCTASRILKSFSEVFGDD